MPSSAPSTRERGSLDTPVGASSFSSIALVTILCGLAGTVAALVQLVRFVWAASSTEPRPVRVPTSMPSESVQQGERCASDHTSPRAAWSDQAVRRELQTAIGQEDNGECVDGIKEEHEL